MIGYTATVSGFDYGFDWSDQFIYVDAGLSVIQIGDLYSAIKEAQGAVPGIVDGVIASGSGLDELDEGISTFLTIRIFDEWEIRSLKSSGKVSTRGGNIVKDNGKDPFFDDGSVFYVAFFSQAGIKTTTETGVSGLTSEESSRLADINSKTADLTFTKAGELDVNLKSVQDTTIEGTGTEVDPWGP